MNTKLIGFAVALALLGSTSVFAGQNSGRDSVYATPGSHASKSTAVATTTRHGRSSVYVGDVKGSVSKSTVAGTVVFKPGRA
jgi:hypothetical protein